MGAQFITPITSLVTALVLDAGMSAADAQDRVLAGLGLPTFDLLGLSPITETVAGNPSAPAVLAAHKAVASAYAEIASLLEGASALPDSTIGLAVMSAMAEQLAPPGTHLDLRNPDQVAAIIASSASRLGIAFGNDVIQATASVVVATTQAAFAVPPATGIGFLEALTRIESAAQGTIAARLSALGANHVSPADAISQTTGRALNGLIAAAPLGPLVPTTANHLLSNLYATPAIEGGDTTLFGSITADAGAGARSLLINWGDGALERIDLGAGTTRFRVDHLYADDGRSGTPVDTIPIGVVLLVDSHAVDAAPASVRVANSPPQFDALGHTPIAVAGGLASVRAAVSDIGLLDTLTLSVNWADGYIENVPLATGASLQFDHIYTSPGHYDVLITVSDDDGGTASSSRSIDVIAPTLPAVQSIQIGDGSPQRSMIGGDVVVFNQPVVWDASVAKLTCDAAAGHGKSSAACDPPLFGASGSSYILAAANPSHDGRTYVVSFIGPDMVGGSLPDGHYTLLIPAASVSNALGSLISTDVRTSFQRLFGDADGDGDVDRSDRTLFLDSYGATQFQPPYRPYFDQDASGAIDKDDRKEFMNNFSAAQGKSAAAFQVEENAPRGTSVGTVAVSDLDSHTLSFSMASGSSALAINSTTGALTVADSTQLDFESAAALNLTVTATDADGISDLINVTLQLLNQPSITGTVFVDANQNGRLDTGEAGIDGAILELLDERGTPITSTSGAPRTATTHGGLYAFTDVTPGTYRIHERQPSGVNDGPEILGSLGGSIPANDTMQLTLARTDAHDYFFGEIASQQLGRGDSAQIAFWASKDGQDLIKQGGSALAKWLTSNFPNVFGTQLASASGAGVATFYKDQLFNQQPKQSAGAAKVDAQFMAVALSVYFTNRSLAGDSAAAFGFNVTDDGIGTKVVDVRSNGAAFSVVNNSSLTVLQLLQGTSRMTDASNRRAGFTSVYDINGDGNIDTAEAKLRSQAGDLYASVNETGGI